MSFPFNSFNSTLSPFNSGFGFIRPSPLLDFVVNSRCLLPFLFEFTAALNFRITTSPYSINFVFLVLCHLSFKLRLRRSRTDPSSRFDDFVSFLRCTFRRSSLFQPISQWDVFNSTYTSNSKPGLTSALSRGSLLFVVRLVLTRYRNYAGRDHASPTPASSVFQLQRRNYAIFASDAEPLPLEVKANLCRFESRASAPIHLKVYRTYADAETMQVHIELAVYFDFNTETMPGRTYVALNRACAPIHEKIHTTRFIANESRESTNPYQAKKWSYLSSIFDSSSGITVVEVFPRVQLNPTQIAASGLQFQFTTANRWFFESIGARSADATSSTLLAILAVSRRAAAACRVNLHTKRVSERIGARGTETPLSTSLMVLRRDGGTRRNADVGEVAAGGRLRSSDGVKYESRREGVALGKTRMSLVGRGREEEVGVGFARRAAASEKDGEPGLRVGGANGGGAKGVRGEGGGRRGEKSA
ncbi:hypothetical protein R3P38DRAFT_2773872 [Favolaschia claudopus]|uniref:Uncharacterized protein n=1 Tax=Favolaschia claudopus TaxID=2862362 RepID=A0AAW0C4K5_9AGAR